MFKHWKNQIFFYSWGI